MSSQEQFRVVIAGGGVAGLEAALALRDLAGERVAVTMLAPEPEFVYRPMTVREPFALEGARHYPLAGIAADIGVQLVGDGFAWLDPAGRAVHTAEGERIAYDALLLALGARRYERFRHSITLDDRHLDEQLHGLIEDIEGNYVHRLAFLIPPRMPWPLPVYELALMTAARAFDMNVELSVYVVTPEEAPLQVFGPAASEAVSRVLTEHRVEVITSAHCEVPERGRISIRPRSPDLCVDRIVALPELFGPSTPGVPGGSRGGFIPVDAYCRVKRLDRVFAAGDATDFPVKLGGIAAQQADTAAASIAALSGAAVQPRPFDPSIDGILLGGGKPLHLSAQLSGGRATSSHVEVGAPAPETAKIAARYLAPYLAAHRDLLGAR